MIFSTLWTALLSIATRMLASMATKDFLEWALFYVAEKIVKRTDTPHDDVWLEKLREAYERGDSA